MKFKRVKTEDEALKTLEEFSTTLKSLREGLIDKKEYAKKIVGNGNLLLLKDEDKVVAFCSFYCNDLQLKKAFLSLIAVKSNVEKRGYGSKILEECERYCRSQGMKYLQLEVYSDNKEAFAFYKKNKFEITKSNKEKLLMIKKL